MAIINASQHQYLDNKYVHQFRSLYIHAYQKPNYQKNTPALDIMERATLQGVDLDKAMETLCREIVICFWQPLVYWAVSKIIAIHLLTSEWNGSIALHNTLQISKPQQIEVKPMWEKSIDFIKYVS